MSQSGLGRWLSSCTGRLVTGCLRFLCLSMESGLLPLLVMLVVSMLLLGPCSAAVMTAMPTATPTP